MCCIHSKKAHLLNVQPPAPLCLGILQKTSGKYQERMLFSKYP